MAVGTLASGRPSSGPGSLTFFTGCKDADGDFFISAKHRLENILKIYAKAAALKTTTKTAGSGLFIAGKPITIILLFTSRVAENIVSLFDIFKLVCSTVISRVVVRMVLTC